MIKSAEQLADQIGVSKTTFFRKTKKVRELIQASHPEIKRIRYYTVEMQEKILHCFIK